MTSSVGEDGEDRRETEEPEEGSTLIESQGVINDRQTNAQLEEKVDELEEEVESLKERLRSLEKKKESSGGDVEIEQGARLQSVYESLSANKKRAADIWRDLPDYADRAIKEKTLVLDHESLRDAIKEVDDLHEMEDVNSNTVSRVRQQMNKMSGGIVEIKQRKSNEPQGRKLVVVNVRGWANLRPDGKVRESLR